jgi:predicted nucleic acid-binding protein
VGETVEKLAVKVRLYLDTSVFSAYCDSRAPDRQSITQEFWAGLADFDVTTSDLAVQELDATADPSLQTRFRELLANVTVHPVTDEMRRLARDYVDAGVFKMATINDAVHVAAAVFLRQDVLLSWNFRHLVNRRRRAQINEVNISRGLPMIEILAPPEI